jgi:large subunit ribosomal protein L23
MKLDAYDIILAPIVSEKSTALTEHEQVVFRVAAKATKPEIKSAVERIFNVKVKAVNTLVRKGKQKVFRGIRSRQGDVKRAIVTLEAGQRIDITSGV